MVSLALLVVTVFTVDKESRMSEIVDSIDADDVRSSSVIEKITPSKGSYEGGEEVTISGKFLQHVTSVTFGGETATKVKSSEQTVTCYTPPYAPGHVDVFAYTDTGEKVDGKLDFTYE
jgi:IPT/TIG domain